MKHNRILYITLGVFSLVLFYLVNRFVGIAAASRTLDAGLSHATEDFSNVLLASPFALSTNTLALTLSVASVACLWAGVFYYLFSKGNFRRGEEYGSSRWANKSEMQKFADTKVRMDNTILSADVNLSYSRPTDFNYERNRNVVVIGGSGSGKTRGYIKPNLMQIASKENGSMGKTTISIAEQNKYARSFVVTDPKGTTRVETGYMFVTHDYTVKEFNTIEYSASMGFNPLKYVTTEEEVITFATCLIGNTTPPEAHAGDPFWEKSETLMYQALLNYILTEVPEEERNLVTLCELLDLGQVQDGAVDTFGHGCSSGLDVLFKEVELGLRYDETEETEVLNTATGARHGVAISDKWRDDGDTPRPNHPGVLAYNSFKSGAVETMQSILISCKVRLSPLRSQQIRAILTHDEMELDKFGDQKMVLYAIMSDQDKTFNFLHALLIWQMLKQLYGRAGIKYADCGGRLPIGVDFLLDEAANFYIPDLEKTVAQCRSRNIGLTIVLQSNAQLESRYKGDAATIIDNCDSLVFLGGKSSKTNEELSKIMGQETVTTDNTSKSKGQSSSWSQSIAQHGRSLMDAAEIAKMPRSNCLVLITGALPWQGAKTDITHHPMYAWVDPGHKGAKCSRGFDMGSFKSNAHYFEHDTFLRSSIESQIFVSRPYRLIPPRENVYAVEVKYIIENVGQYRAYNVHGSIDSTIHCLSNEYSRDAGKGDLFPLVEPFGTSKGLRFERSDARTNKKPLPYIDEHGNEIIPPDYLFWDDMQGKYVATGFNLEPGEKIVYVLSFSVDRKLLDLKMRPSFDEHASDESWQGQTFSVAIDLEPSLLCGNADISFEPTRFALSVNAKNEVRLSTREYEKEKEFSDDE